MSVSPRATALLLGALTWMAGDRAMVFTSASAVAPPTVEANDNRRSAGVRHGDTVVVRLTAAMARWFPEDSLGAHVDVLALAEDGHAPQIPAPLLRVPTGTILDVSLVNALADSAIWIKGIGSHPNARPDSVRVAPGDSVRIVAAAGLPGTYTYFVWPGIVDRARSERETAGGAIIIDSTRATPHDRVFVVNIWSQALDSVSGANALTINGRSWPHTERLMAAIGDTLRWRIVNASMRPHPMHLHGEYFRLEAKGDGNSDTVFAKSQQRSLVTDVMAEGGTMLMSWVPKRPGNWLFHCHIGFHVVPDARLVMPGHTPPQAHDAEHHMAGLILGIRIAEPAGLRPDARIAPRRVRIFAQEGLKRARAPRTLAFVLQQGATPPAIDSVAWPGSPLYLHVGEPTDVTVVNRLREPTAVHWHGIELESYSDGVAGWSGVGARIAQPIAPGDSFVAHLTLRRAGTFIYHTHLNDLEQFTSGLYGAIVVLPKGARFDARTDHLFVAGWDGPEDPPHLLVNGDSVSRPLDLVSGVTHRFRFINIGVATDIRPQLCRDSTVVPWRVTARDGAELPVPVAVEQPSGFMIDVGQTADFVWRPMLLGSYRLTIRSAGRADYFVIPVTVHAARQVTTSLHRPRSRVSKVLSRPR